MVRSDTLLLRMYIFLWRGLVNFKPQSALIRNIRAVIDITLGVERKPLLR